MAKGELKQHINQEQNEEPNQDHKDNGQIHKEPRDHELEHAENEEHRDQLPDDDKGMHAMCWFCIVFVS